MLLAERPALSPVVWADKMEYNLTNSTIYDRKDLRIKKN